MTAEISQIRPAVASARLAGMALVLLSAAAWSMNGLYARFLTIDLWTALVGRAIATALMLLTALFAMHGRGTGVLLRKNMQSGVWVVFFGTLTMIAFVAALFNTTVANVTVIYAVSPLFAAFLARFLIGDRLSMRTLLAFSVAVVGVVIVVGGSWGSERILGDAFAMLMAAGFAIVIVEMRRKPEIDNTATSFLSSLLLAVLLFPLATLSDISPLDGLLLILFGFSSNVLGFFAFVAGVRRIPPAEAGLIATIEVVLAPLWVWLLFGENPGLAALIGGAIILGAIIAHLAGNLIRANLAGGPRSNPGHTPR